MLTEIKGYFTKVDLLDFDTLKKKTLFFFPTGTNWQTCTEWFCNEIWEKSGSMSEINAL